jgi:hypothetical protein
MIGVLGHNFALMRLYWAGEQPGLYEANFVLYKKDDWRFKPIVSLMRLYWAEEQPGSMDE